MEGPGREYGDGWRKDVDMVKPDRPPRGTTELPGGGKMIYEGLQPEADEDCKEDANGSIWSLPTLLTLAVATSIDALATGLIFTPYDWKTVLLDVAIIGLASVFFSRLGYRMGQAAGRRLKINVEVLGGLVLIGIGVKIFVEGMGWL